MTYAATKDLRLLQKQLSHSRITTTQIYADVMPEQIVSGMDAMERMTRAVCKIRPSEAATLLATERFKAGESALGDPEYAPAGA